MRDPWDDRWARLLRFPVTWFVVSFLITTIQTHISSISGPTEAIYGVLAVPFLSAIFGRWKSAIGMILGYLSAMVFTQTPWELVFAGAVIVSLESAIVIALVPSRWTRISSSSDLHIFIGLVLAAVALRAISALALAAAANEGQIYKYALGNASGEMFALFSLAPFLLTSTRTDSESRVTKASDRWEFVLILTIVVIGTAVWHGSAQFITSGMPWQLPVLSVFCIMTFWIAFRFEIRGVSFIGFLIVTELVVISLITGDTRLFHDPERTFVQQNSAYLVASLLLASSLLIAGLARGARLQARESLLLVAALRQKAEKMTALNHKLTIQTGQIRDQSELLLIQCADLEEANQKLAEQKTWLDAVLSNMPIGVYVTDKTGKTIKQCQRNEITPAVDRPGTDIAGLEGENPFKVFDSQGQPIAPGDWPIMRALRSGHCQANEILEIRSAHHPRQWLSVNASPIRDPSGNITGAVATSVNVTDRENTRKQIVENETRVRFALQAAKAIVWEREVNGRMTNRTSSMAEWIGVPDHTGFENLTTYFSYVHADDRDRCVQEFQRLSSRTGEFSCEYRMLRADGSVIWILTRGVTIGDEHGRPQRIVGVHFDITVQKETELRLRFLESAVVHTRDAVVLLDANVQPNAGRSVLYVNDSFCKMSGYRREEVIGRSLNLLRGPESDAKTLDNIRRALESGQSYQAEVLNYRKNNQAYWSELTLEPVRDSSGVILHWVMIQRDITDRRRASDALRRSEEMFRGIFENAWAGVSLTDHLGRFVSVNPAFLAMFQTTETQVIGRTAKELTDADSWERQASMVHDLLNGRIEGYQIRKEYRRPNGTTFWGELFCNAIRGPGGEYLYGLGVTVDVTERTRLENQLRDSEARLRAIYENSAAGVIIVDLDAVIIETNPAFARMLGYEPHELIGIATSQITHPDDLPQERAKLLELMNGEVDNMQIRKRYLHRSGELIIADLYTRCIRDTKGQIQFRIGITIDMTEKVRLEDQLRHSQKMEAIGQMAGGIAHDFNNLLTAIIGNLSLVRRADSVGNPELLPLLNAAEQAAGRAADLTRKLLGFARKSQLQLAPLDPKEVIIDVVDILRFTLDPLIVIETDLGDCPTIRADETLLHQVILNLCLNSRDAMPNGGRLVLATAVINHESPPYGIKPGAFVNVSVTDTGTGIDAETRGRIFEPFFTTKSTGKGTGLGLSMVMGTVQQHGGWVDCTSDVGIGTRFDIYLPITDAEILAPAMQTSRETPLDLSHPKPRAVNELILVVDDEPLVRSLAKAILETGGFRVAECEDGVEAVDWVRAHPGHASLIVLDVTMPRLSGLDAYEQIRQIEPSSKVIFSSGYSAEDMTDVIATVGMLAKPYRPSDLLRAVRETIDRPMTIKN